MKWVVENKSETLTFEPKAHEYTVEGVRRPSASGIISDGGLWGTSSFAGRPMDAAIRGTRIHAMTEKYDNGELDEAQLAGTAYGPYLTAWQSALSDLGAKVVENETKAAVQVTDEEGLSYIYCGTVDRVLELPDGKLIVADIKTGGYYRKPYSAQLAAYWILMESLLEREIAGVCCIMLSAEAKYKVRSADEPEWRELFYKALRASPSARV